MIRLKKMMALAIAMVMVICTMNFTVFADPNPGDLSVNGDLTVSGIGENDVVEYYQLLKWDTDETTGDPVNGWVWGDGVTADADGKVGGYAVTDIIGTTDGENKITAEKAGALASAAATAMTDPAGSNSGGTWTATGVPAGLYMVIITSKTPGTMYNPIFVAANFYGNNEQPDSSNTWAVTSDLTYSNQGMAKKSVIPVDKEAEGTDTNGPDTVDVGEEVNYTITTKIPKFASNYINPVFQIEDTLTGLELKAEPVVKAGTSTLEKGADKDYTIEAGGAAKDDNFTIKFTKKYLDSVAPAGQDITVEYTAIVNDTAELVINQEINTVDIKFSTDPKDTEGHGILRDETNHFTFSIDADFMGDGSIDESSTDAIKIGVDKEGNPIMSEQSYATSTAVHAALAGAVFELYTDEACTNLYTNTVFNGSVTSDDTGRITINGLDAGNYWLKEKTAPAGFVKMQDPIPVTIEATITNEVKVDYEYDADGTQVEVTYYTNKLDSYTVTIGNASTTYTITNSDATIENFERDPDSSDSELVNTKGVELPATGGMGTTIFYVIGAILVLGAGILLVTRRRMDTF